MKNSATKETWWTLTDKIGTNYAERVQKAQKEFMTQVQKAATVHNGAPPAVPANTGQAWTEYATDFMQRSVMFWDIMRERGNTFLEHVKAGTPPLLAFEWEMISDGRTFKRPVNYALLRIIPPAGMQIDDRKRPIVIIDPRAGHGPGVGGFKKDSEVGVALRFGHPVYFVIFFPEPEPDQTILDVNAAESKFLETVIQRHPDSPKPVVYGNCQAGWASMLLAANDPAKVGVVVTTGAPMSYWSGSWSGGRGENPMRYSGGLLGGAWTALLASDLGNGKFDGAYLVENFENLNPANTLWNKYNDLWKNIDTDRERFLEFERWWGGYFLMNEEEIRWIVENLFVGNRLARGEVKAAASGSYVNLKAIRSPIVIFSSKGDNITPPQQAINWISDVYSSTAEIKANGQVIVGLFHEDAGHLGIFVSGKVAQKEHAGIVEVLDYIELLLPGLYVMEIKETSGTGKDKYLSSLQEVSLEDLRRANKLERRDEKPFEIVEEISIINEKIYSIFWRPLVRNFVNEITAEIGRRLHPLRAQRWFLSDINPVLWPSALLANAVRSNRKPADKENPFREVENAWSEMITASLNLYRDLRDAAVEAVFFQIYGSMLVLGASGQVKPAIEPLSKTDDRELPYVKEALEDIDKGGYPEAIARIGALASQHASPVRLYRLEKGSEFIHSDKVLSTLSEDQLRRIRSEAAVMVLVEPEATLQAIPKLLTDSEDRKRVLELLDWGLSLEDVTPEQRDTINRIEALLGSKIAMPERPGALQGSP